MDHTFYIPSVYSAMVIPLLKITFVLNCIMFSSSSFLRSYGHCVCNCSWTLQLLSIQYQAENLKYCWWYLNLCWANYLYHLIFSIIRIFTGIKIHRQWLANRLLTNRCDITFISIFTLIFIPSLGPQESFLLLLHCL